MTMNDVRTGRLQLPLYRSAIQAYKKVYTEWIQDIRQFCSRNNVFYLFIESHENIAEALLKKGYKAGLIR